VLNLLAAQALLGCGDVTDAGRIFVRLAQRVSEGEVSFGSDAVGMPATSIRQQAVRCALSLPLHEQLEQHCKTSGALVLPQAHVLTPPTMCTCLPHHPPLTPPVCTTVSSTSPTHSLHTHTHTNTHLGVLPMLSACCSGLAQCALAQGDTCQALHHYGELVSRALMGRGTAEHWAYAEYGWLLFQVRRRAAAAAARIVKGTGVGRSGREVYCIRWDELPACVNRHVNIRLSYGMRAVLLLLLWW
jgi:hypothetical protein